MIDLNKSEKGREFLEKIKFVIENLIGVTSASCGRELC